MQFANDRHVQLIGLFLVIVHVDDELLEHLGLLEIAEILHGLVQRHAALLDEVRELQRIMMDEMHVVHVEALHDVFDVVDDVVEVLGHVDDVLALDRRDEIGSNRLEDGVVDLVALVLQLVRALHDLFEMLRLGEAFDGLDQQLGFLNGNFRLFLERIEIIELVPLAHRVLLYENIKNRWANANPSRPHPGNVSTHVFTISIAIPHFTALFRFAAPTPMMAVVFVCVVETGKPAKVESIRQKNVATLAANPWNGSSFTISRPTLFMMRSPPTAVPNPMLSAQKNMSQMGRII